MRSWRIPSKTLCCGSYGKAGNLRQHNGSQLTCWRGRLVKPLSFLRNHKTSYVYFSTVQLPAKPGLNSWSVPRWEATHLKRGWANSCLCLCEPASSLRGDWAIEWIETHSSTAGQHTEHVISHICLYYRWIYIKLRYSNIIYSSPEVLYLYSVQQMAAAIISVDGRLALFLFWGSQRLFGSIVGRVGIWAILWWQVWGPVHRHTWLDAVF